MSNANGIAATDGIDYFYLEDITESKASAASADISEAQADIATSEAAAEQASSEMSAQLASQGYLGNANFAIWQGGSGSQIGRAGRRESGGVDVALGGRAVTIKK